MLLWVPNRLLQFRAWNLKLKYSEKKNKWIRECIYISRFHENHFIEISFSQTGVIVVDCGTGRIVRMYACLQLWRLNCVAPLCLFLSADVESGHVSTNSALRMLFRFMFHVMLQCLLRKLMVLQHIENLNAVSVVRGISPRNSHFSYLYTGTTERSLMHWHLHISLELLRFLSNIFLHTPCLLFILFFAIIWLYPPAYWCGMNIKQSSHYKTF
jgi:hypothetical protein